MKNSLPKARWMLTGLLILSLGYLYSATIAPTITWSNGGQDSGELAATIATMGVAHPPGYPSYALLSHFWSYLPIGGDLAYRLNWLSAIGSIVAAVTIPFIGEAIITPSRDAFGAALWGGLLLGTAPLIWSQSIVTEVYAVGLGFLGIITLTCVHLFKRPTRRKGFFSGLLLSFSLGILPQLGVLLPLVLCGIVLLRDKRQVRAIFISNVLGILVGLLSFIYIPIRAAAYTSQNWGMADNWERFLSLITAMQYRYLAGIPDLASAVGRTAENLVLLLRQVQYWGAIPILVGGWFVWRKSKRFGIYLAALLLISLAFTAYYDVMNSEVYLMPAIFALCLVFGIGVSKLLHSVRRLSLNYMLRIGLGCVFFYHVTLSDRDLSLRNDFAAKNYAENTLGRAPAQSIIFTSEDAMTFPLWYLQASGIRDDVIVIDTRLLLYPWYQNHLAKQFPDLDPSLLRPGAVTKLPKDFFIVVGTFPDYSLRHIEITAP